MVAERTYCDRARLSTHRYFMQLRGFNLAAAPHTPLGFRRSVGWPTSLLERRPEHRCVSGASQKRRSDRYCCAPTFPSGHWRYGWITGTSIRLAELASRCGVPQLSEQLSMRADAAQP